MPAHLPTISATDLVEHLRLLYIERALAQIEGLATDTAYIADLEEEIATCRSAYVGAAVTDIACLRGRLSGRLNG